MKCPKCGQTDKGFAEQALHVKELDNNLQQVPETEAVEMADTQLYYCGRDECDWVGSEHELRSAQ